jgi:hypothetical protein
VAPNQDAFAGVEDREVVLAGLRTEEVRASMNTPERLRSNV